MRHRRRSASAVFVLLFVVLTTGVAAQAPPSSSPEARERMQALAKLVGEWEGEAWSEMRPGVREVVAQHELVEWAAGGEALIIRGRGSVDGRVVHEAVALVVWDARAQRHTMWTYRAGSGPSTPQITVTPDGLVWGFSTPGGEIRFTQSFDAEGRWVETGERSADGGKSWQTFLGMKLTKK